MNVVLWGVLAAAIVVVIGGALLFLRVLVNETVHAFFDGYNGQDLEP